MIDVTVQLDKAKLAAVTRQLAGLEKALPTVMSRGINRTLTASRTEATRQIASQSALKKKTIRSKITLEKATRAKWAGKITISGRAIPLIQMSAHQTRKGVTYLESDTEGRQLAASAFIAVMDSGHRGVFARLGKARLPIEEQFSKSLAEAVRQSPDMLSAIHLKTSQSLVKYIDDQVRLVLSKR